MNKYLISICLTVLCGCNVEGGQHDELISAEAGKPPMRWKAEILKDAERALTAIQTVLDQTQKCPELEQGKGNCALERVFFRGAAPLSSSVGQRILVIDEDMKLLSYTRYKDKVLGHFVPDNDNLEDLATNSKNLVYRLIDLPVIMPRAAKTILSDILGETCV